MSPDERLLRRLAREVEAELANGWVVISDSDMFFATSTVLCLKHHVSNRWRRISTALSTSS